MPIFELLRPSKNTKISPSKRAFAIKPRGLFPELRYAYFRLKKMLKLCFYLIYLNLNLVKTSKFNTMQKTSTWHSFTLFTSRNFTTVKNSSKVYWQLSLYALAVEDAILGDQASLMRKQQSLVTSYGTQVPSVC